MRNLSEYPLENYGYSWSPRQFNETKCAEIVSDGGRSVGSHQCYKASGHGPNNLFCSQHAERFMVPDETRWAVTVGRFRTDEMEEVGFIKETPQTLTARFSWGTQRCTKGKDYVFFETELEAIEFVIERKRAEMKALITRTDTLQDEVAGLLGKQTELLRKQMDR